MNLHVLPMLICIGLFATENSLATVNPSSLFSAQDKHTILVAAGTTVATWGIISLTQKLFTRIRPAQKHATEPENPIPALQKKIDEHEEKITTLKNKSLTLDASGAVFGLFQFYGILDQKGEFKNDPENKLSPQPYAIKNLKLITSIPGRVESLEKETLALKQEVKELTEKVKSQAEQLASLATSRSETMPSEAVVTDTKK